MTGMIGHHAQAVRMSNLAPTNGASASHSHCSPRASSTRSSDEIALMQRWLRDRGTSRCPRCTSTGHQVMVHGPGGHAHHAHMPGMLTDAQMDSLAAAHAAPGSIACSSRT
jgi:hypothetical protein